VTGVHPADISDYVKVALFVCHEATFGSLVRQATTVAWRMRFLVRTVRSDFARLTDLIISCKPPRTPAPTRHGRCRD